MGDALQERVAKLKAAPSRYMDAADQRVGRLIRRESWMILRDGMELLVLFTPPRSLSEIEVEFPRYRGCRITVPSP